MALSRAVYLKIKQESYIKWKHGEIAEEYKRIAQVCMGKVRKKLSKNELHLPKDMKGNKKRFFKYIRSKRKMKGSTCSLLSRERAIN